MNNSVTQQEALPLLVMDSGLGGLCTFQNLDRKLPGVPLLYHGDTAYAPYGDQPHTIIQERVARIIRRFQQDHQIQGVVVACNTSASVARETFSQLERELHIPILTILQGSQQIFQTMQENRPDSVTILATSNTINSGVLQSLGQLHGVTTTSLPCPKFVPLLESPFNTPADIHTAVTTTLAKTSAPAHVLLGCTHYELLIPHLKKHWPQAVYWNPAEMLTTLVITQFSPLQSQQKEKRCIYVSGDSATFYELMSNLFAQLSIMPEHLNS